MLLNLVFLLSKKISEMESDKNEQGVISNLSFKKLKQGAIVD